MLLVPCPFCGPRPEIEFRCGGEAHIRRPDPATATDQEWAEYLFYRKNPKGLHFERWCHAHGCGRWFNAARDTVSEEFKAAYHVGEPAPVPGEGEGR
jgi:sarcosine oxidase subunit delta